MSIVDKLTPHPPQDEPGSGKEAPEPLEPKAELTPDEQALLTRASTFVLSTLKKYGITPSADEVKWLGAEVADFANAVATGVSEELDAAHTEAMTALQQQHEEELKVAQTKQ